VKLFEFLAFFVVLYPLDESEFLLLELLADLLHLVVLDRH
jgi:hypothetical protein